MGQVAILATLCFINRQVNNILRQIGNKQSPITFSLYQ